MTQTGGTRTDSLDLETVLRASAALAGEIELDALMAQLLRLAAENAGADAGSLLLRDDKTLRLRALWTEGAFTATDVLVDAEAVPASAIRFVERVGEPIVVDDARTDARFHRDPHIQQAGTRSLLVLPLRRLGMLAGVLVLENRLTAAAFTPQRIELLTTLSAQMAISLDNAQLVGRIRTTLDRVSELSRAYQRFVPEQLVQLLGKEEITDVGLGDSTELEMAVLFSDIRAFTTLSEQLGPQGTFRFLNAYLGRVGPVIRQHGGFIDKYIGDAVMALFPRSAADAVGAALAIQEIAAEFAEERASRGEASFDVGVGLHTGRLIVGTVGETERMEGTVISDVVNTGSRLEGLCKHYGVGIVASREIARAIGPEAETCSRFLGRVSVKGRAGRVDVYEIFGDDRAGEGKRATRTDFEAGAQALANGNPGDAIAMLSAVRMTLPDDQATRVLLREAANRLQQGLEEL